MAPARSTRTKIKIKSRTVDRPALRVSKSVFIPKTNSRMERRRVGQRLCISAATGKCSGGCAVAAGTGVVGGGGKHVCLGPANRESNIVKNCYRARRNVFHGVSAN